MLFVEKLDYKSLFDHNPDAILTLYSDGIIIQMNKAVTLTLGYMSEELLHMSYEIIIHPNDFIEVEGFFNQAIQGIAQQFESTVFHKDQGLVNLWIKLIPIVMEDKVEGVYFVAKDITNVKRVEKRLRETQNKLEEVFIHTADAINVIDLNGNTLQINPAFELLYGWKEHGVIGKPLPNLPPERTMEPQEFIDKIKKGEIIKNFETTRIRRDGSVVEVNLTYSPINDLDGGLVAIAGIARDITEKKRYEEIYKFLAYHDPLTGLINRRLFIETLERKIKEAELLGRKFAVMYMDMDNFKKVNDTFGHQVGDELLKQFAKRIQSCLQDTDVIARIGGDEFSVLISETSGEQSAAAVAEKIIEALQKPWKINNEEFITTSSVGITINRENDDEKNLLKRADIALYQAKENGRNNYRFFL